MTIEEFTTQVRELAEQLDSQFIAIEVRMALRKYRRDDHFYVEGIHVDMDR